MEKYKIVKMNSEDGEERRKEAREAASRETRDAVETATVVSLVVEHLIG